jgi:hypothetical protein
MKRCAGYNPAHFILSLQICAGYNPAHFFFIFLEMGGVQYGGEEEEFT